jgi:predicted O-linked N-acetylglucosamine transferase (SPINDLY family)
MPGSYLVNVLRRETLQPTLRAELGIPLNDFAFYCFSQPHRILAKTFAMWMHLLGAVQSRALWPTCVRQMDSGYGRIWNDYTDGRAPVQVEC